MSSDEKIIDLNFTSSSITKREGANKKTVKKKDNDNNKTPGETGVKRGQKKQNIDIQELQERFDSIEEQMRDLKSRIQLIESAMFTFRNTNH